jgi:hypothetical protein
MFEKVACTTGSMRIGMSENLSPLLMTKNEERQQSYLMSQHDHKCHLLPSVSEFECCDVNGHRKITAIQISTLECESCDISSHKKVTIQISIPKE